MKKITLLLFLLLISNAAFAMPNPEYVPFDNIAQFGKYIEEHMGEIIDSSVALAKKAKPQAEGYFLVTEKVYLETFSFIVDNGKAPFAKFEMSSGSLKCTREIFSKVTANQWGEGRVLNFYPSPTITCQ